jgi:hypothetical protein
MILPWAEIPMEFINPAALAAMQAAEPAHSSTDSNQTAACNVPKGFMLQPGPVSTSNVTKSNTVSQPHGDSTTDTVEQHQAERPAATVEQPPAGNAMTSSISPTILSSPPLPPQLEINNENCFENSAEMHKQMHTVQCHGCKHMHMLSAHNAMVTSQHASHAQHASSQMEERVVAPLPTLQEALDLIHVKEEPIECTLESENEDDTTQGTEASQQTVETPVQARTLRPRPKTGQNKAKPDKPSDQDHFRGVPASGSWLSWISCPLNLIWQQFTPPPKQFSHPPPTKSPAQNPSHNNPDKSQQHTPTPISTPTSSTSPTHTGSPTQIIQAPSPLDTISSNMSFSPSQDVLWEESCVGKCPFWCSGDCVGPCNNQIHNNQIT